MFSDSTLSDVHTPQVVIKRSRSASFDTKSSTKIKSQNINKTLFIDDKNSHCNDDSREINNIKLKVNNNIEDYISFKEFYNYCKLNFIDESISNTISICQMQVDNLFRNDNEFKNLSPIIKKCLMVATIIKIGTYKTTEFTKEQFKNLFNVDKCQSDMIDDMLKEGHTNYLSLPNDYYYYSIGTICGIADYIQEQNFPYNIDIRNKIIDYTENIFNKINNHKIKNIYFETISNYYFFQIKELNRENFRKFCY